MRKALWISALLGAGAAAAGCGGPPPGCDPTTMICIDAQMPDAGPGGDDGGVDAGDGGPRGDAGPCPLTPGRNSGAACTSGDRCLDPLACQAEIAGTFPGTIAPDGGAGPALAVTGFPDSMCATICDPDGDGSECNADCESCNGAILAGRVRFGISADVPGTCRPVCTPTTTGRSCARDGYACDVLSGTCMEACTNDEQCQFAIGDPDGDGNGDIVWEPDSGATCNTTTGRCEVPGDDTAVAGDPCETGSDCEDNGFCLTGDDWPGGYCSRFGCEFAGFECDGADEVCDVRAFGDVSGCFEGCTLNAETTAAQRLGAGGGNPTCTDAGFTCMWNGLADPADTLNGSCLPGNYNAETTYDVGTACLTDADCFSPFGYGRCLFSGATDRVQSGICAIGNCNGGAMGMPIGILGSDDMLDMTVRDQLCNVAAGDLCVNFGGMDAPPATFCIASCTSASECPTGYACPALLGDGGRICWPNCTADADCRTGTMCRDTTGATCGMGEECYCTDAMPAPDAGTDAGTPATDAGSDAGP